MATGRLAWEELMATVRASLPQPVAEDIAADRSLVMTGGDPGEVIVRLTRSAVTVFEFAVRSQGAHGYVVRPIRLGGFRWRRMPASRAISLLEQFIRTAQESRRSKYALCRMCKELKPPERMHEEDVCQGCAGTHLGVVF